MTRALIAWCTRRPGPTLAATLVVAALAAARLPALRVEAFPDVTNVQVMVIGLWPGQAAEEVERRLTIPLERALTGLPLALGDRSITSFGLAQVILTFADEADIYRARQQVAERIATVDVPEGAQVELGPNDTPVGQIYQYTLDSDVHTPTELRGWQEWYVARRLSRTPGVADVVSFGGFQREVHVLCDPAALRALGLDLAHVIEAVAASNHATSGGYLRHGESEFVVRGRGYLRGTDDLEATVVTVHEGTPVLLGQVATVTAGHTPRRGSVARGLAEESVEGIVLLRRGENPRRVLAALHREIAALGDGGLPAGMRISPFYDRSRLVGTTLHTVTTNMLEGAVLVAAVIWIFLRTLRGSLAVVVTMPLAILAAFAALSGLGVPANLLSVGAIDFGILLDGAVILVENVYRRLAARRPAAGEVQAEIADAAHEVVRPALFGLAVIAVAMAPIFSLERVEGRIFRPMALTYAFALAGALAVTLTTTPALLAVVWRRGLGGNPAARAPRRGAAEGAYLRALSFVLGHKKAALGGALLLVGLALMTLGRMGREFLPTMNEGDLHVTVTMPSRVSLDEGRATLAAMRREILAVPEVLDVVHEQGHPEDGTDDEAPNQAKTFVALAPPGQWRRGTTTAHLVADLRARLAAWPGVDFHFSAPIKDRVEEAISGVRGQVVVKIFGDDLTGIEARMRDIRRILASVEGARDVEIYRAGTASHVVADVDRRRAARFGLSVRAVEDSLAASLEGTIATTLFEGERPVGVRVKLPPPPFGERDAVASLPVLADGAWVPLGEVATVDWEAGRTQINREGGARFLALKCNIEGRDMGGFVAEAREKVRAGVALPEGTRLTWGGEFENQERAMRRLAVVVPGSVGLIFLLLCCTFGAARPALAVLFGLPFAAVGGIFALALVGEPFSVSAAVGFVTLFGVATMDGVLVVTYLRAAAARGADAEGLVAAVAERLRPVVMTALLASLGLVPAAMSRGIGAEVQRPFAIVIIGGLCTSTVLTLLLLPSLFVALTGGAARGRRA